MFGSFFVRIVLCIIIFNVTISTYFLLPLSRSYQDNVTPQGSLYIETKKIEVEQNTSDYDIPLRIRHDLLESIKLMNTMSIAMLYTQTKHHDLATTLMRPNNPPKNLLYIYIPKSGSTFMKMSLREEFLEIKSTTAATAKERPILHRNVRILTLDTSNYTTFTVLRDPRERIISAYSTLLTRFNGRAGKCDDKDITTRPLPENKTDIVAWENHFTYSIHHWMKWVNRKGFENAKCQWDVHIIPQIEFMKGYDIQHIGCLDAVETTLMTLNFSYIPGVNSMNAYERNKQAMPGQKFQTYELLSDRTKELITKVYIEDVKLYNSFCT